MNHADIPELDQRGLRQFGLTFAAIVGGLFGLVLPWLLERPWPLWPWIVAGVFVLWAVLRPGSLRLTYRLWMRLGLLINAVMTRLVLGVVFYAVVSPTGLVARLRGHDAMARRWLPDAASYRVASAKLDPDHMEKPF